MTPCICHACWVRSVSKLAPSPHCPAIDLGGCLLQPSDQTAGYGGYFPCGRGLGKGSAHAIGNWLVGMAHANLPTPLGHARPHLPWTCKGPTYLRHARPQLPQCSVTGSEVAPLRCVDAHAPAPQVSAASGCVGVAGSAPVRGGAAETHGVVMSKASRARSLQPRRLRVRRHLPGSSGAAPGGVSAARAGSPARTGLHLGPGAGAAASHSPLEVLLRRLQPSTPPRGFPRALSNHPACKPRRLQLMRQCHLLQQLRRPLPQARRRPACPTRCSPLRRSSQMCQGFHRRWGFLPSESSGVCSLNSCW